MFLNETIDHIQDQRHAFVTESIHGGWLINRFVGLEIDSDLDDFLAGAGLLGTSFRGTGGKAIVQTTIVAVFRFFSKEETLRNVDILIDFIMRPMDSPNVQVEFHSKVFFQNLIGPSSRSQNQGFRQDVGTVFQNDIDFAIFRRLANVRDFTVGNAFAKSRSFRDLGHGRTGGGRSNMSGRFFIDARIGSSLCLQRGKLPSNIISGGIKRMRQTQRFHGLLGACHTSFHCFSGIFSVKQKSVGMKQLFSAFFFQDLPLIQGKGLHLAKEGIRIHLAVHAAITVAAGHFGGQGVALFYQNRLDTGFSIGIGSGSTGHTTSEYHTVGHFGVFRNPFGKGLADGILSVIRVDIIDGLQDVAGLVLGATAQLMGLVLGEVSNPTVDLGRSGTTSKEVGLGPFNRIGQNGTGGRNRFGNMQGPFFIKTGTNLGIGVGLICGAHHKARRHFFQNLFVNGQRVGTGNQKVDILLEPLFIFFQGGTAMDGSTFTIQIARLDLFGTESDQFGSHKASDFAASLDHKGIVFDFLLMGL
mmetsp:Transcript_66964/g.193521  ORF Transcript_66964/g.193521 Transcript_66964/m.193521 type:complete len:528 (-) Transcript_66964:745-2328(-)